MLLDHLKTNPNRLNHFEARLGVRRDYVTVEEAIGLRGLRVAFTRGVPAPWGEAARAFFDIKGIDYYPVIQIGGEANAALQGWTGQNSAPCAVFEDERPRSHWSEVLMLAERLEPTPRLIPVEEHDRTTMFGISHELCGEDGFGWSARMLIFEVMERSHRGMPIDHLRRKFSSSGSAEHAAQRVANIMNMLGRRLQAQLALGSRYLVGQTLTAADIYWTTFSNLVAPMAAEDCPVPERYRIWSKGCIDRVGIPVPTILLDHRQFILKTHFILPMWF